MFYSSIAVDLWDILNGGNWSYIIIWYQVQNMKWWAAGHWRLLHCLILLQEQGSARLPRLTWPPATFSMSIPVKRRHTPMTSPLLYLMEEMRCTHTHTHTHTQILCFMTLHWHNALWIISNHAGEHNYQVLYKIVEYLQLECWSVLLLLTINY